MKEAIYNCQVFAEKEILEDTAIIVEDGIITDLVPAAILPPDAILTDLGGLNISASFIDLQIYGGNGRLFSNELSIESLQSTYAYCKEGGASHFMITMATNSIDRFLEGIDVVGRYWQAGGRGLLGLHLEGPFINSVKRGAHIAEFVIRPTLEIVDQLLARGKNVIKIMTLAPECCEPWVVEVLNEHGILISAGHSNATYAEATDGFDSGIPAATHLFNAMSPLQGREPGMVGAIYDHGEVISSVVCDGVHVDFASIRVSKKILGERLFFITDAVTETTTGEYIHRFRGDRYCLPDGTLSGSALTMMQCVKNGVVEVGIPLDEALRMASLYPAKLAGLDARLGSIAKGKQASFVVFNDSLEVEKMIAPDHLF